MTVAHENASRHEDTHAGLATAVLCVPFVGAIMLHLSSKAHFDPLQHPLPP
jgi:hypothetical protein